MSGLRVIRCVWSRVGRRAGDAEAGSGFVSMGPAFTEYLVPATAFICFVAAAAAGASFNVRMPSRHLADETLEVVRNSMNMFVVMTSVVLGLMLDSARNTYETNDQNTHALATEIILLDRNMRTLGPEGDEVRRHLTDYVRNVLRESVIMDADPQAEAALDAAGQKLRAIRISEDQKLAVWNDGRQLYRQVERDRWVALGAAGGTLPPLLIATLIVWLVAIFAGVGYRAPRNAVVTTTFVVSALLLSSALYLILELDRPASGLIRISSAPFERTLEQLQR